MTKKSKSSSKSKVTSFINNLGIISSTLCIIDCVVLPLLLIGLSILGFIAPIEDQHQHDHGHDGHEHHHDDHEHGSASGLNEYVQSLHSFTHGIALYFIIPIGALSLVLSFLKHRKIYIPLLGGLGIALLLSPKYWPQLISFLFPDPAESTKWTNLFYEWERYIEILGSLTLLSAQLLNRRQCACCDHKDGHSHHDHHHHQDQHQTHHKETSKQQKHQPQPQQQKQQSQQQKKQPQPQKQQPQQPKQKKQKQPQPQQHQKQQKQPQQQQKQKSTRK